MVPWVGLESVIVAFPGHIHARIQRGGTGGPNPSPPEKSQKYRVS